DPTPAAGRSAQISALADGSSLRLDAAPLVGNLATIDDVPPGAYSVQAVVEGFETSTSGAVTVVGGQTTDLAATLVAIPGDTVTQPPLCITIREPTGGIISILRRVQVCIRPKTPIADEHVWAGMREFAGQADLLAWLRQWRDWLDVRFAGQGIGGTEP